MDRPEFDQRVRESLDAARDILGRIEETVRETGEDRRLMEASRVYARYCMAAREYLHGSQLNRPFPRRYAEKVRGLRDELAPLEAALAPLDAKPDAKALTHLIEAAESQSLTT